MVIRGKIMKDCSKCIHVSTPKGMSCYTMIRRLKELVSNKNNSFTPEFVIPALEQIVNECKRYKWDER